MKVNQACQLIIVFELIEKEENTITCKRGILTRLIKRLITPNKGRRWHQAHNMKEMRWIYPLGTSC